MLWARVVDALAVLCHKAVAMAELEIEDVAQNVNFPAEEEKILAYWDEIDAFKTSLKCAPLLSAGLG